MSVYLPLFPPERTIDAVSAAWQTQAVRYALMWSLYDGTYWNQLETKQPTPQRDGAGGYRRFRLGVNPIQMACNMHAYCLFGETDAKNFLPFTVAHKNPSRSLDNTQAQEFLEIIWHDSHQAQTLYTAGLVAQITGGAFLRVRYNFSEQSADPFAYSPFKIELVQPDYVYPVWSDNYQYFPELYIRYTMTAVEAQDRFGVSRGSWRDLVQYEEHWTSTRITIRIGEEEQWVVLQDEANPFGLVPFVYIPHVLGGEFYGIPLPESVLGLVEEYNARLANLGDLIKQAALRIGVLRGTSTSNLPIQPLWPGGPPIVFLGTTPKEFIPPELEFVDPPLLNEALVGYIRELERKALDLMSIPPVAIGQDEGSQRSALTLMFRMWPLRTHVQMERWLWESALDRLMRMALHMAATKDLVSLPVPVRELAVHVQWPPMMPKDREQLVAEIIARDQAGHIDPERALLAYGDISPADLENTIRRIREYQAWRANIAQSVSPVEDPVNVQPMQVAT